MTDFIVRWELKADDLRIYRGKDLLKDDPRLPELLSFGMPAENGGEYGENSGKSREHIAGNFHIEE